MKIFENKSIYIEIEQSEIPWLKIFSQNRYREFSECDRLTKESILVSLDIIEREMLDYFKADKINIASFGNYLPHLHFHIMARFKDDSFFPESMWGVKQRESNLKLPNFELFYNRVDILLSEALIKI